MCVSWGQSSSLSGYSNSADHLASDASNLDVQQQALVEFLRGSSIYAVGSPQPWSES